MIIEEVESGCSRPIGSKLLHGFIYYIFRGMTSHSRRSTYLLGLFFGIMGRFGVGLGSIRGRLKVISGFRI